MQYQEYQPDAKALSADSLLLHSLLTGLLGALLLLRPHLMSNLFRWSAFWLFLLSGAAGLLAFFFGRKQEVRNIRQLLMAFISLYLAWFAYRHPAQMSALLPLAMGANALLSGFLHFVTCYLQRKNNEWVGLNTFVMGLLSALLGMLLVIWPVAMIDTAFVLSGLYCLMSAATQFTDYLEERRPGSKPGRVWRRVRVDAPPALFALVPKRAQEKINRIWDRLSEDASEADADGGERAPDFEIFIHATEKGLGTVGHVDICFEDVVRTYGPYDFDSHRWGGLICNGVLAVISGVVVYAVSMVNKVEDNLKPEENATSLVEEIQTLEEYKGDVVNILVCGIDYEEGRAYSSDGSNDGMTDMILYCQFDIKGGALRMLQIPRNSLVATQNRKITLSNGKTYAATNYQINSVALSNGGDIAALAEVIYDQYKLPIDYYVTIDMQALVEMVDNFGGIEVYIPHDMSFAGSVLKQGYRNLDGASAEFFVRCRHGEGYANSDIDRLNMQRYFYAGLFKRVRSMGVTDVIAQLPLIFNNYIHTDMDLTTIAKMLVSFTRIDSANIMLAQTPVFMGVPNVGKTSSFDGYSCVVPDAGSIAELLNTYFRNYTGPVSAEEMNLVTNNWPHGTASTSANVQFVGQLDKESDDAILSGDTDVAGATTTDGQAAGQ